MKRLDDMPQAAAHSVADPACWGGCFNLIKHRQQTRVDHSQRGLTDARLEQIIEDFTRVVMAVTPFEQLPEEGGLTGMANHAASDELRIAQQPGQAVWVCRARRRVPGGHRLVSGLQLVYQPGRDDGRPAVDPGRR